MSRGSLRRGYSRQEREQQIAAVHHLSRKTQKNYLLRPKSLIDALARPEPASAAEIRALAEIECSSPVTSLYLRMDPESTAPRGKALARIFHSLKTGALEEQKDFIEALPKAQKEILNDDLKEIEVLLDQYFVPAGPRSLIIFKCGEQLNRVFRLPAWTIDAMVIGGDPHVAPLEAVLEENETVLFVEVSSGESRLLVYHLGDLESDRIQHLHTLGIGPSRPSSDQRTASPKPSGMASQSHGHQGLSPFPGTFLHRLDPDGREAGAVVTGRVFA